MQTFEFRKSNHHRPSDRDVNDGNKDRKTLRCPLSKVSPSVKSASGFREFWRQRKNKNRFWKKASRPFRGFSNFVSMTSVNKVIVLFVCPSIFASNLNKHHVHWRSANKIWCGPVKILSDGKFLSEDSEILCATSWDTYRHTEKNRRALWQPGATQY